METHFASPERAGRDVLEKEIRIVSKNPVIDGLMNIVSGLLAVLNQQRQVLAVNDSFLRLLGLDDVREAIGLRLGEAIHCVHAHELPGGCGTSEFCSSCGAAIATVACLDSGRPAERKCAVTVEKNSKRKDQFYKISSYPVIVKQQRYVLLFMNDISKEQQWATMERLFFHDLNNIVHAILSRSELMLLDPSTDKEEMARDINALSLRLSNEISIQRQLFQDGVATYQPVYHIMPLKRLLKEIRSVFSDHSTADRKSLVIRGEVPDIEIKTDFSLVMRILINMITNALEATPEGGRTELFLTHGWEKIIFSVWNEGHIPEGIGKRIFQRNFSTKEGAGRGLGTYSMKYFGEEVLGGKIDYNTSETEGTVFRFEMPIDR
jgi:hypothetical protein